MNGLPLSYILLIHFLCSISMNWLGQLNSNWTVTAKSDRYMMVLYNELGTTFLGAKEGDSDDERTKCKGGSRSGGSDLI